MRFLIRVSGWKGRKKIPGQHRSHIAPKRGAAATVINRNQGHPPALLSPTDSQTTMTLICAAECRSTAPRPGKPWTGRCTARVSVSELRAQCRRTNRTSLKRSESHFKRFFSFRMVFLMVVSNEAAERDSGLLSGRSKKDQITDHMI